MENDLKVGDVGSFCYAAIPGCWSPMLDDAIITKIDGDMITVRLLRNNKIMTSLQGGFLKYLEQRKFKQLSLF